MWFPLDDERQYRRTGERVNRAAIRLIDQPIAPHPSALLLSIEKYRVRRGVLAPVAAK